MKFSLLIANTNRSLEYLKTICKINILPDEIIIYSDQINNRVSNFLLWDLAYTEIYFTNVLWPDFQSHHFDEFLQQFKTTERRFGHTDREIE